MPEPLVCEYPRNGGTASLMCDTGARSVSWDNVTITVPKTDPPLVLLPPGNRHERRKRAAQARRAK